MTIALLHCARSKDAELAWTEDAGRPRRLACAPAERACAARVRPRVKTLACGHSAAAANGRRRSGSATRQAHGLWLRAGWNKEGNHVRSMRFAAQKWPEKRMDAKQPISEIQP